MSGHWKGLFPALWTPTDAAGRLLTDELSGQVQFLREAGADGIMVLGSTGEFVHLDLPERREVLRVVVEAADGWPIIANCSDVNPRHVAELGRFARDIGVQAVSLLPPWFFALSPADLTEFMVRGAEASGLPLMLYNFPERTGHRLALETIASICERVPVVALKQSGAEFAYHRELAQLGKERGFVLITGADTHIEEAFRMGAEAVVSGLANAVPEWILAVFRAVQEGDPARAEEDNRRLQAFVASLVGLEFPVDVAAAMRARGRATGEFKQVMSASTRAGFDRAVTEGTRLLGGLSGEDGQAG